MTTQNQRIGLPSTDASPGVPLDPLDPSFVTKMAAINAVRDSKFEPPYATSPDIAMDDPACMNAHNKAQRQKLGMRT